MKRTLCTLTGFALACLLTPDAGAKETVKPIAPNSVGVNRAEQTIIASRQAAAQHFEESPFIFIQNAGQIKDQYGNLRRDIDYKLDVGGMVMFVGGGQVHYQWSKTVRSEQLAIGSSSSVGGGQLAVGNLPSKEFYRMDVKLVGANRRAVAVVEGEQQYKEMYYLPYHKDALVAHSYSRITYKNVYPNIDWVVYVSHESKVMSRESGAQVSSIMQPASSLKYDFIVHPGGNPADIKIQYSGATSLQLKDGRLIATTPMGSITENAPYSYFADNKEQVSSSFKLNENTLSYNISNSESRTANSLPPRRDLIIDPQLLWGTYYGGSDISQGMCVEVDAIGNVYMAGITESSSNIATTGTFQTSYAGGTPGSNTSGDGFLAKFTPEGKRIWANYFGGSDQDGFSSIALSGAALYISGYSNSSGLSTAGSHQPSNNGYDALLVKFDTAGTRVWATYYGGSFYDAGGGIACDGSGNVYMGGETASTTDIASTGAYQTSYAGGSVDMFLAKFSSAGVRQWGTYYGGSGQEHGGGVTCDAAGNVYICSNTQSSGLGTAGTFQPSYSGTSNHDALLSKFTSAGTLSWATYYGLVGAGTNCGTVAVDASGNVYMASATSSPGTGSTTYFATTGAYQGSYGGGGADGYLVKFSNTGTRIWGTYYGGSGTEGLGQVELSPVTGNIYVAGITSSSALATTEAYQNFIVGSSDALLAVFSPAGAMVHATYYGGFGLDYSGICAPDNWGRVYMPGFTNSTSFIATAGAFQTTNGNSGAAFTGYLSAWVPDTAVFIKWPYVDTVLCAGDSLIVKDTVFYGFRSGNTFTVQLSDATGSFASPVNIGTVSSRVSGNIRCRIPIITPGGTGYRIRIVASNIAFISADDYYNIRIKANVQGYSLTTNTPVCEGDTIRLTGGTTSTGVSWQWNGQPSYSSTNQNNKIGGAAANMAGDYKLRVTLNSTGCSVVDSQDVRVKTVPDKPVASSNTPVCFGAGINFTATSTTPAVSWSWTGPTGYSSTSQNPTRTGVTPTDGGNYIVSAILNGCSTKDTETVVVYPAVPTPIAGSNSPVCAGGDVNLTASNITGATYAWTGPSYASTVQNPSITNAQLGNSGTYSVIATLNGCQSIAGTTAVTVVQGPTVLIYPSPRDTICNGKSIVLNSLITGAGTGATYQWVKNGSNIPSATTVTYTDNTVINGDSYSLVLTPGTGAACATPVTSSSIPITVLQYQTPFVTMTASDTNAWPGLLINFEATAGNAGDFPKYQWKLNGKNVVGATSNTWGATSLNNNDSVCIEVTSSYICASPTTAIACKRVKVATGIRDAANSRLRIYPNPASRQVTIEGLSAGTKIQLNDVYGRVVYSAVATQAAISINTANLVPGNYILQVTDSNGVRSSYKLVKE